MRLGRIAAVLAVGIAMAGSTPAGAHPRADDDSLRAAARGSGVRIGTAVDMSALAADTPYREGVAREFDTVTPENVMKWEAVEPQPGVYDWAAADRLVDFARQNGQLVRGHTLVWHSQNPAWLTEATYTPAQLRTILRNHIFAEMGHFKGRIWAWDVANEVFNEDGTLRDTIWLRALGPGYIADAFRWAHQADPKALLFLNDYNNEGINAKSDAYFALVKQLRAQGVPVHGYGMQGHLAVHYGFPDTVLENVRRFDKLGLKTAFTEVDVRMQLPTDSAKVQAQAEGFGSLLRACLLVKHCVSYTVWGFTDKYSWVPGVFEGEGSATPADENFQVKPAWNTLRDTFLLVRR
ncbi:endo-1,4-beta-xylanase [Actinoplanes teichomyceticus]|uniref:Beta-xylanase n=1 Tax=Actinoplanes teichomyceticus TaxID=1867 RepID=A0A561WS95_ACTTI|nr:endo-1,4-beta-xylanase [Actinoplanes teichomyceticus]TWG26728.1 endo-1,4-beta-xylanase [Actinoplanes teichomyceticus]GIF15127.1 beta-xylanase [Actinoplanes teichomyceticus]